MLRFVSCCAAVLLLAGSAVPGRAGSILVDGGFENTPDCSSLGAYWLASGTVSLGSGVNHTPGGSCSVAFSATPPDSGTLTQSLLTIPGDVYMVQFWLFPELSTDPASSIFQERVNGVLGVDATATAQNGVWNLFTSYFTGTGVDILTFLGANTQDVYYLDDVSVTDTSVPEPATLGLLGFALIAAGATSRRRLLRG